MSYIGTPIISKLNGFEDCVNHMYLDTKGCVTVGVGQMIPNAEEAKSLFFLDNNSHTEATDDSIMQEYETIVALGSGRRARSYKPSTTLYMPTKYIYILLDTRLLEFEIQLRGIFKNYSVMSQKVKRAIMDMVFNLGAYGLRSKFPKLTNAINREDWEECAIECHRKGISKERNKWTAQMFGSANL